MMPGLPLSEKRVTEIMNRLSNEQRIFIQDTFTQGKRSKWVEILAKHKGIVINEEMTTDQIIEAIDNWLLEDILDGGYGNRPYKCECGKSLRFQYIVHHQTKNKTFKLGSTCFEYYTKLPPDVLRDIKQGFHHIDLERDELLLRVKNKDHYNVKPYLDLEIPNIIQQQIDLGLPLTEKQINFLQRLYKEKQEKKRNEQIEKRLRNIHDRLTVEQKLWIDTHYKDQEKRELLIKLENGIWPNYEVERLKELGVQENIIKHIELKLPLLESQVVVINRAFYINQKNHININNTSVNYESIDYESLMQKHLETLKEVRNREQSIPSGLLNDWGQIQETVRKLKNGEQIDYRSFLVTLSNLLSALGIYKSIY